MATDALKCRSRPQVQSPDQLQWKCSRSQSRRSGTCSAQCAQQIPPEVLNDPFINEGVSELPRNYNFEVHKSLWRIKELQRELGKPQLTVVLQMPQGLQMFACMLADIFTKLAQCEVVIIADENYGACCVEDVQASILQADFLIHYGELSRTQLPGAHSRDQGQGHVRLRGHRL